MTIAITAAIIIYVIYRVLKNRLLLKEKRYYENLMNLSSKDKKVLLKEIDARMNDIIDISNEGEEFPKSRFFLEKYHDGVPSWDFLDINSYNDLYILDLVQLDFYSFFRKDFLKGFYYDLEGNYNYALLLAYDLADEFDRNQELMLFSKRMKKLAAVYPKVGEKIKLLLLKRIIEYGNKPVKQSKKLLEDSFPSFKKNTYYQTSDKYNERQNDRYHDYYGYSYGNDYWKLGSQYRSVLDLSNEQVKLLNHIYIPSNNFFKIEFCAKEIIFLYLAVITQLDKNLKDEGLSRIQLFEEMGGEVATKEFRYHKDSYNYKNCIDNVLSNIYIKIFRLCENAVREHYDHKRKLTIDGYSKPKVQAIFKEKILSRVEPVIASMVQTIQTPDEATEQELNAQNKTRWKTTFEALTKTHTDQPTDFEAELVALSERNKKNTSAENIFFEAAKYIAPHHKTTALRLYIRYLSYGNTKNFKEKSLTQKVLKQIFKESEHQTEFEKIVEQFKKDRNLKTAFGAIEAIFTIKRKTIQLDRKRIEDVKSKHADTVDLLNEYLQDDVPIIEKVEKTPISAQTETSSDVSTFHSSLSLQPTHIALLQLFEANGFKLSTKKMDTFANSYGVPKNTMITAINDACAELLEGEALIEEEEDEFVIFDEYFEMLK